MRHHCCSKQKVKRGLWSPEEDAKLVRYIARHGHGCWSSVPKLAGLQRCGKSCRLRWINYLRPDLKRGTFTEAEERIIIDVHRILGNRWAKIARHLPGRTDNEVKNFWNSCIKKKLLAQGLDPRTHNLLPSARPSCNNSSGGGGNSSVISNFSQFNNQLPAAAATTPFTISTVNAKGTNSIDIFQAAINTNSDDILQPTAADILQQAFATLPQDPMPFPAFQYQDSYVPMGFKDQNSHNLSDYTSSLPPLPTFSPSQQFPDESCMWGGGVDEALQAPMQDEVQGQVQPQVDAINGLDMSYNSSHISVLGLMDAALGFGGGFSSGSSMEQMPWD